MFGIIRLKFTCRSLAGVATILLFLAGTAAVCQPPVSENTDDTADAVILEQSITYEVNWNGAGTETVTGKIKINNSEGRDYGYIAIGESSFEKVTRFSAAVHDASGRLVLSRKKDDCQRVCGYSAYGLYADVCYRGYTLTTNTYPYIVEYAYTRETKSSFFWPHWSPQTNIPVRLARYTAIVPSDTVFSIGVHGDIPPPVVGDSGKARIYVWQLTDIPPLADEDYSVPGSDDLMMLLFSPTHLRLGKYDFACRDWGAISQSYDKMVRPILKLGKDETALLADVPRDISRRRQCETLHRLLAARMRYVAIEIGVGGWQPCPVSETFQRGYGDCKDLAAVYAAMLSSLGIDSRVAYLKTRSLGATDSLLPVINQFNHAITMAVIDNDTVWIDPTCRTCPVGDLPSNDEDVFALVVDSAGGGLVRTPSSTALDNLIVRKADIDINPDKSIAVRLELTATGNIEHYLSSLLTESDPSLTKAGIQSGLAGLSSAFSIDSIAVPPDSARGPVEPVTIYGRMPNAIHLVGDKQYVSLEFISFLRGCEKAGLSERARPLDLSYPRAVVDSISLTLPPGWQLCGDETPIQISDDFGRLECDCRTVDGKAIITRRREANAYTIAADQLKSYRDYLQAVSKAAPERIVLCRVLR
ncbi:MAG: DUF3857 domain-containing protein [candidate division Zixibacteria bacterium]|nr:DUF3857 domain-containing protein [candidate division Zixibacteria bacterium]